MKNKSRGSEGGACAGTCPVESCQCVCAKGEDPIDFSMASKSPQTCDGKRLDHNPTPWPHHTSFIPHPPALRSPSHTSWDAVPHSLAVPPLLSEQGSQMTGAVGAAEVSRWENISDNRIQGARCCQRGTLEVSRE